MSGCYGVHLQRLQAVVVQCTELDVSVAQYVGVGGVALLVGLNEVAVCIHVCNINISFLCEVPQVMGVAWDYGILGNKTRLKTSFQYSFTKLTWVHGISSASHTCRTR